MNATKASFLAINGIAIRPDSLMDSTRNGPKVPREHLSEIERSPEAD
jgi:hypothetical protein